MSCQLGTPSRVRRVPQACHLLGTCPLPGLSILLWGPTLFPVWGSALTCALISCPTRVRVRYQKRQKLQFETKLGMNSPF